VNTQIFGVNTHWLVPSLLAAREVMDCPGDDKKCIDYAVEELNRLVECSEKLYLLQEILLSDHNHEVVWVEGWEDAGPTLQLVVNNDKEELAK
jgi:hypothetical protein